MRYGDPAQNTFLDYKTQKTTQLLISQYRITTIKIEFLQKYVIIYNNLLSN